MKIVFINSIFPNPAEPLKGNFIQRMLQEYPQELELEVIAPVPFFLSARRRKKVVVPFFRSINSDSRHIRVWHPRYLLFPRNIMQSFIPIFEYLAILPILILLHKRKKIDALHANFCLPDGVACSYAAQKLGIPYLITEHRGAIESLLRIPRLKHLMFPAYANAFKVITVSQRIKDALYNAEYYKQNAVVIPNGIDLNQYPFTPNKSKPKKLIFIGNLVVDKGVQVLIEAFASLAAEDYILTIVGDGPYKKELMKKVQEHSLEQKINFWGEIPNADLGKVIAEHHILVHPSFQESFGIVVLEALACGKPVVATYNGGSEFILQDGHGVLVPAKDAVALADGIRKVADMDCEALSLRNYVKENFALEKVIKDTLAQYPAFKRELSICHLSSVHVRSDVRVFYKQCKSLVDAGYKVHLVVCDGKRHERKDGVIIHDAGAPQNRKQRMLFSPFKVFRRAWYINADAYQIHDPELLPLAILFKLFTRKPIIYDIHESYPEMFLHKEYLSKLWGRLISLGMRLLESVSVKLLDHAIAATEHIAGQFKDVRVVHNYPILAEWLNIQDSGQRYKQRKICYVGSITRERGIAQIIKAIEHVDCELHLAGSYEPPEFREELIAMPGFAKVVEYGYVNREQAAKIFANSALGVVLFDKTPNHLHSLSTKMFEYMAAGLPIMVSDLPSNVKLLDTTAAGIYIDPDSVEQIAQNLERLLSDPQKLSQWGANGRKAVVSDYSWENEKDKYLGLYSELFNTEKI
jgi:glycosyltransferase involved in cell wall biosynthesis